jgi:two-component system, cell cycle response regulator
MVQATTPYASDLDSSGSPKLKPVYRALVVDDHIASQKLLALSLSMQPQIGGIDCVSSGAEAIQKAKDVDYDIIFLDVVMSGMDGYQACAELRKIPKYKHTSIIMVTGLNSPLDEAKGIIAGSTTYITKPVQQVHFREVVEREIALVTYKKSLV